MPPPVNPLPVATDFLVKKNSEQPVVTGPIVEENTRTGFETTRKWRGSYVDCFNQRLTNRGLGIYAFQRLEPAGGGDWLLTGIVPLDEFGNAMVPVPSINELEVEVAQVAVAYSPKLNSLLTSKTIAAVLLICNDFQVGKYATYDNNGHMTDSGWAAAITAVDTAAQANGDTNKYAEALFTNVVGRGLQAALEYHTIYSRTLTAARPVDVQASYLGAGQIWTTSEVNSQEGIGSNDWFQLPVNSLWLKSKPKVTATAHQKTQLFYTYTEIFQATALLYDAYGSAVLLDS